MELLAISYVTNGLLLGEAKIVTLFCLVWVNGLHPDSGEYLSESVF